MDQKPERGEIGEAVVFENLREVGFDVGGPREARVIAHEPQTLAIAAEAPQGFVARIQPVLQRERRRAAPAFDGEFRRGVIEIVLRVDHNERRTASERLRGDGEGPPAVFDKRRRRKVSEPKDLA